MDIDFNDPSWTVGIPWYENRTEDELRQMRTACGPSIFEFRGGDRPEFRAGPNSQAVMEQAGVQRMISEAAQARKAHYSKLAKEAIAKAEQETREDSKPVSSEDNTTPVVQVRERAPEGREIPVDAPVEEHMTSTRSSKLEFDKPLPKGASWVDLMGVPESQRGLSLGRHLRGMLFGDWRGGEAERDFAMQTRAMSGASAGAGGALLPVVYSAQVVDLARVQTQVLNAGAQIVPMSARQVIMPKWTGDPTVNWRSENGAVATGDGTVDKITFTAQSLAGYTTLSREIIEDTDLSDLLAGAYAKAVAIAWDNAALLGTGTAPQPCGLKNNTAVTDKSALATNGATPTWDNVIDAVGAVRGRNESVSAIVYHPRNELALGKVKDTQNRYLDVPRYVSDVPRLSTGTLPVNETTGSSSLTNSMFVGDFSQLYLGMRTNFSVDVYDAPAATTGQVLMVAWLRMDCQVGRGSAFAVRTGLLA